MPSEPWQCQLCFDLAEGIPIRKGPYLPHELCDECKDSLQEEMYAEAHGA